jgi:TfoX/Sxy family transcriptional regulator of competence genes
VKMPRPTSEDEARFRALVPNDERVTVKPMFANFGAFVNGTMFMGLFGADVGLKLDEAAREELRAAGGGPFGPAERPMGGYVTVPPELGDDEVRRWVQASLAYAATLPPKKRK